VSPTLSGTTLHRADTLSATVRSKLPQVTGSLITAVRDACRNGLLDWSPRLMLAMYACDIQASSE
jgi:translation elongation factor EF-G